MFVVEPIDSALPSLSPWTGGAPVQGDTLLVFNEGLSELKKQAPL